MAKKKRLASESTPAAAAAEPAAEPRREDPPANAPVIVPPRLQARNEMMDRIAATAAQQHTEESATPPDDDIPAEPLNDDEIPLPVVPAEEEAEPEIDAAPVRKVKIKVDGQEREVPEDAIREAGIRALQKESAADKRLQEATELLNNAQRLADRQAPRNIETPPSDESDVDVDALARHLQFGTEDEVKSAVKTLLARSSQGRPTATPDSAAIVQQVEQRIAFNSAIEQFQKDFTDVWEDERLRRLTFEEDMRIQALIAKGEREPMTYSARFAEAGKAVRAWRDQFGKNNGAVRVELGAGKQADKAAASSVPTAGGRASLGTPSAAPQTPTAIVAEIRKARGQHV